MAYHYHVMSERADDDEHFFDVSLLNFNRYDSVPFPFIQRGIHANNVKLVWDPTESSARSIKMNFSFSELISIKRTWVSLTTKSMYYSYL